VRIAFAECVFDSDTREVFRGGGVLALSPKAFELLELLVQDRPKALSKQKIHGTLWPKVFVSDASLSTSSPSCAALGDDARRPRIVRTVHRFGYAFVAESTNSDAAPATDREFRLFWETREISLRSGENILGRDRNAVVWVDDPSVSRHHARILVAGPEARLEDLGSKNGTLLNGERIEAP
jgi:DNA-binding winged helix-turn-helix (wHTH) protein